MGSLWCRSKRSRKPNFDIPSDFIFNEINLANEDDAFAKEYQGKVVNGIKFPSGIEIPSVVNGKNWVLEGKKVVLR